MTETDHNNLYDELKQVIYTRGYNVKDLTPAQEIFVSAMEQSSFGADFLKVYAELVDDTPDINIRNLHAFCLGFGLGLSGNVEQLELTKTFH